MISIIPHEHYIIFRLVTVLALLVYLVAGFFYWCKVIYAKENQQGDYYKLLRNCSIVMCLFQTIYLFIDLYNNVQKLNMQGVLVSSWKYIILNSYPLIIPLVILTFILHRLFIEPQNDVLYHKFAHGQIWLLFAIVPVVPLIVQSFFFSDLVNASYLVDKGKEILMSMQGRFVGRELSIYLFLDTFMNFVLAGAFWTKRRDK